MITVFNQQVSTAVTQVVQANLNVFNEASGGALVLGTGDFLGDWLERTFWAATQMVERRNAYGTGKVTAKELGQILERAVKVDGRVGPLRVTDAIMERLGKNPQEAAAVMAQQIAEQMLQDYIDVGVGALIAATPALLNYDFSAQTGGDLAKIRNLVKATGQMGDAAGRIKCYVMSGMTYNDLLAEDILVNANQLFSFETVNVFQDGLGRRFVVTDALGLDAPTTGATPKARNRVLCLTPGAIVIDTNRPLVMKSGDIFGEENLAEIHQGEYSFNLALKGYSYVGKAGALGSGEKATSPTEAANKDTGDTAATGSTKSASPNDATLTAPSSWKITDPRWTGAATTGRPAGDQLEVVKGLAGVIATFGAK